MEADERECPFCAEIIKKKAKVCKHCQRDVEPETPRESVAVVASPAPKAEPNPEVAPDQKMDEEAGAGAAKSREVVRFCRLCGHRMTGKTAAEFREPIPCPSCNSTSRMITQKEYDAKLEREKTRENEDRLAKEAAEAVHKSLNSALVLRQDEDESCYYNAWALGIVVPWGIPSSTILEMAETAKSKGAKRNPYVDLELCRLEMERRRPFSSKQQSYLNDLHASTNHPLTVRAASKFISALTDDDSKFRREVFLNDDDDDDDDDSDNLRRYSGFPCPHCKHLIDPDNESCPECRTSLDQWRLEAVFDAEGNIKRIDSKWGGERVIKPIIEIAVDENVSKKVDSKPPSTKDAIHGCLILIGMLIFVYYLVKWLSF